MKKIKLTPRKLRRMEEHRLRKEQYQADRAAERTGRLVPVVRDIDERNRQNAQASTGPVTEEGKAASSRNAVRHGLTGIFCILPHEDRGAFELLLGRLWNEHQPADATEELLVSDMARHYWLAQRALAYQEDVLTRFDLSDLAAQKQLALFIRYQTTNQRIFHKSLAELQKLQKLRQANNLADSAKVAQTVSPTVSPSASGFVSQNKESQMEQKVLPSALSSFPTPESGFVSQNEAEAIGFVSQNGSLEAANTPNR